MKKIIEFLEENNIEYRRVSYGDPHYYNDGFTVPAIMAYFDFDLADDYKELERKRAQFLKFMSRKKAYTIGYQGKSGIFCPWYSVFTVFDFVRQQEHENRIQADVEAFWKEEHARREAARLAAVM